jgi:hypothetical protein
MNNGSINLSVTGGTNPYAYSWSNGSNTKNISSLTPGAYTLILQDASGCIAIRNYTITQPAILTDSVITINATCGNNDGTATVVASGGNTPYAYSWSDGQTNANATGLSVGTIYVTITDAKGCNKTDSSSVTVTSLPQDICLVTVDSTSTKNIVVWQKPVTGNISHYNVYREIAGVFSKIASVPYDSLSAYRDTTNGVNPQITSYKYKISAVDTCGNESVLSAYHKTLHLTKNVGTSGEVNLIWDGYVGFSFNYYRILRDSTSTGNFQVLDSVGTSNFTYTDLTPPSGIVDYLIEVVHFGGPCLATKAAENHNSSRSNVASKIPPAPLTVSINSVNATGGQCNGTATANATGGQTPYTYQWNTSPVQTSQTATGLCAGTYTVIVTDANSATVTDSIVIIQTGTSLNATTSVTDATQGNCDGTATVTPSGGQSPYSYQWNTSPVQTNQTATGLCAGNYSVTVTDSNNSTITVTATVGTQPGILSNANVLKDVLIYPNPNLGVFTIEISEIEKNKETTELSIYNVLGELVYQSKIIDQKSTITLFAAGVYYLRMVSGQEIVNKKVIVE